MQALHPGSLSGVAQHSRYEQDPLGRLSGTIRWLTVTTFGSVEAVQNEAGRVNRMHTRVSGEYQTAQGESASYRAADPRLLLWVHIAFMESFLRAHQNYSKAPIPGGADAYVKLWGKSVAPLGLDDVPASEFELNLLLDEFSEELIVTDKTRSVINWIKKAPLPPLTKPVLPRVNSSWMTWKPCTKKLPVWWKSKVESWGGFFIVRTIRTTIVNAANPNPACLMRLRPNLTPR